MRFFLSMGRTLGCALAVLAGFYTISAHAELAPGATDDAIPQCMSGNQALPDMDDQVAEWKTSTPNQYHARARVSGRVTKLYKNQTGHAHFEIQLAAGANDLLEVVYDLAFGGIPQVQVGDSIEACGDYITSFKAGGGYQASPDGALIHWIHKSDNPKSHPDGYLVINGTLYGQELPRHR